MILTGDYHTHTPYSDGKSSIMENALAAKEKGLKEIAITDHGFNHLLFGLRRKNVKEVREQIEAAKIETGVNVLMGMESNLVSIKGKIDMCETDYENFDILLFGIHEAPRFKGFKDWYYLMLRNTVAAHLNHKPSKTVYKNTTKAFINAVKNNPVDILTHINFRCFCDVEEVAKCCADYGTYMEINTKKYHVTAEELKIMADTGVRFLINSDAHTTSRIGDTVIAEDIIARSGINLDQIDNIDGRFPKFRFAEYKLRHM